MPLCLNNVKIPEMGEGISTGDTDGNRVPMVNFGRRDHGRFHLRNLFIIADLSYKARGRQGCPVTGAPSEAKLVLHLSS